MALHAANPRRPTQFVEASPCERTDSQASGGIRSLGGKADPRSRSFERVYEEHFGNVRRWIRSHGARPSDVDDLVQEVFIVAHRRFADFDGVNPAGWLYQIARRKVRDSRCAASFKYFWSHRAGSVCEEPFKITPLDELETSEKRALLASALDKLPDSQRTTFFLYELDGYTGEEIALLQATPINTVWARIHRARRTLRARSRAGPTI